MHIRLYAILLMAGIMLAEICPSGIPLWGCLAGLVSVSLLALWRRHGSLAMAGFVALGFTLHTFTRWQQQSVQWDSDARSYQGVVSGTPVPQQGERSRVQAYVDGHLVQLTLPDSQRCSTLHPGSSILFVASMQPTTRVPNPGSFSYPLYLQRHGISGTAYVSAWCPSRTDFSIRLTWAQRMQLAAQRLGLSLQHHLHTLSLPTQQFQLLSAMLLGQRAHLPAAVRHHYQVSGSSHLLALSGLHLGILCGLFGWLLVRRCRFTRWRWLSFVVMMALVWTYVLVAGVPVSLLRAAAMYSLLMLVACLYRNTSGTDALALTVILMLVADSNALFDVGTQLSVVATLSILAVAVPLTQRFHPSFRPLRWVCSLAMVSLVAWFATQPLVACYFHSCQPWSPVLSLLFVPMTTVLVYLVIAAWLVPPLTGAVSWLLHVQWHIMDQSAMLPGVHTSGLWLTACGCALIYGVLVLGYLSVRGRSVRMAICALLLLGLLPVTESLVRRPTAPQMFYDVRQCPTAHIIQPDGTSLLLSPRHDSVWHYLRPLADDYWAYHRLSMPRLAQASDGLLSTHGIRILQVHDGRWLTPDTVTAASTTSTTMPTIPSTILPIDYLHVCRGFRGPMSGLATQFRPRQVIIDSSVGYDRTQRFIQQCDSLGWPVWQMRTQGALVRRLQD